VVPARPIRTAGLPGSAAPVRAGGSGLSLLGGGFLLLAAALGGGAVWLAAASADWQPTPGFAQLWLVPARGNSATLGVRDAYPGRHTFRLVLSGGGTTSSSWDLTLTDGETWQRTVTTASGAARAATLTTPGQTLKVTS
jgi:hypothetical protein